MNTIFLNLLTPAIGLTFWTGLVFLILMFLLAKFAWKPILNAVNERESSIEDALKAAENAKAEMAQLNADNEKILIQARSERDKVLKEAKVAADKMISEAQEKASSEGDKLIASAKEAINNEKKAALTEVKNQVAILSIEVAEKILRKELSSKDSQKELVDGLIGEVTLN